MPSFSAPNLNSIPWIKHLFLKRHPVHGSDWYHWRAGSDREVSTDTAYENRLRAARHIGENITLSLVKQVHGNIVLSINKHVDLVLPSEADAQVTVVPNLCLGVLTADCVPILLADKTTKIVATTHAGWRGSLHGIVENTVKLMLNHGANCDTIAAAIGPCIRQESYEIGQEVYEQFLDSHSDNDQFFIAHDSDKFMFDLPGYVKHKIFSLGINDIWDSEVNTYNNDDYHSYRRATHHNSPLAGLLLSMITIT